MMRTIWVLTLASACTVACNQANQPQSSAAAGQTAPTASPPATEPAQAPAGRPADSAPAATSPSTAAAARQGQRTSPPAAAAPAAERAAAVAAEQVAPAAPAFREVTIPAGTALSVTMLTTVASNTSKVEDPIKGSLAKAVTVSGAIALPVGTPISGSVLEANESGRVKGRASIVFRFDRLVVNGETTRVQTASVKQEAAADTKSDVKKGGIGAGAGAIVGGIIGGGKGAAIGAVAGGTGAVLATKGKEVEIPSGTIVSVLLQDPLTVTVPVK